MELLKFCVLLLVLAISQFDSILTQGISETYNLVAGDPTLVVSCEPEVSVSSLLLGNAHLLVKLPQKDTVYKNMENQMQTKYPPTEYGINIKTFAGGRIAFGFNLTKLKVSDSGTWQCINNIDGTMYYYKNITLDVRPAADVDRIVMTMAEVGGSGRMYTSVYNHDEGATDPVFTSVTIVPGQFRLKCETEGGYPQPPMVNFFVNGNNLGNIERPTLNLTTSDVNAGCIVKINREGFHEHQVYLKLNVQAIEPKIHCMNTTVRVNDKRAILNCTVVATDVTCRDVFWKRGKSSQLFQHGGERVQGYSLSCRTLGKDRIWTALEMKNVKKQHFQDTFFVAVEIDGAGADFQKGTKLHFINPGALGGAQQIASLGTMALIAIVTVVKMIL